MIEKQLYNKDCMLNKILYGNNHLVVSNVVALHLLVINVVVLKVMTDVWTPLK